MRLGYALGLGIQDLQPAISEQTAGLLASIYDGTNDYAARGANLTGISDSKLFIFSAWLRIDGGAGTIRNILRGSESASFRYVLLLNTNNTLKLILRYGFVTDVIDADTTETFAADSTWHWYAFSMDSGNGDFWAYYDDTALTTDETVPVNQAVEWTACTDSCIGARVDTGGQKFNGAMSEYYLNIGESLDLSVQANRRKLYTATGLPADLGADGSLVTGSQPIIYAPDGDPSDNKGTGGNYTITGALESTAGPGA